MDRWPHQIQALTELRQAVADGESRICLTSPTGGGKTVIIQDVVKDALASGQRVSLYTNRKLLLDQLSSDMMDAGIYHGVRASGYADERDHKFQISSIQTEASRVLRKRFWSIHPASIVIVDEAHLHKEVTAKAIFKAHAEANPDCVYLGVTATPIGLGGLYDKIIVAGNMSQLRACGAVLPARCFAAESPDVENWKKLKSDDDIPDRICESIMMQNQSFLIGSILRWFRLTNPDCRPSICFGPSVAGSVWIAEQFCKEGIPAAHIDGKQIWMDGEWHYADDSVKEDLFGRSREGRIKVICNRYVMREGLNFPWLSHCIFATIFGCLQSYLQSGGRVLRSYPGLEYKTIQDHGGNWIRFDPLNADRIWHLDWNSSDYQRERNNRLRNEPAIRQPFCCPECGRTWVRGRTCQPAHGGCGHTLRPGVAPRKVFTAAGSIREVTRPIVEPRKPYEAADGPAKWEKMYWRARSKKWNAKFYQAEALFFHENGSWPDRSWPLMPVSNERFHHFVSDVSVSDLIPKTS